MKNKKNWINVILTRTKLMALAGMFLIIWGKPASAEIFAGPDWKIETLADNKALEPGDEQSWTLPEVPIGRRVLLRITTRRQHPILAGYGYYVQYLLNGQPLNASINRAQKRLANKEISFRRPNGAEIYWNVGDGLWHTFFAPDFNTDVSKFGPKLSEEPYSIVLDVTDLIQRDAPNVFSARSQVPASSGKEVSVIISLGLLTGEKAESPQATSDSIRLIGTPEVEIISGGGFALKFGKERIPFESKFSFPGGGYNELAGVPGTEGEEGWKPEIRQIDDNHWEVQAMGSTYRLKRVLERKKERITVRDTFTNLTSDLLGIMVSNALDFKEVPILSCRMGGYNNDTLETLSSPANSTLFYPLDRSSLGVVVEDDVFRNQSLLYYDYENRKTGIRNEIFSLAGGESYTAEWSIYWNSTSDYFDFINLVRRDWNANITLEGPFYFTNYRMIAAMSDENLQVFLKTRNPKYVVFWELGTQGPSPEWGNKIVFGHGPGMFDPSLAGELKQLRTAIAKIRRVAPEIKLSLYNIAFFVTPHSPDDPRYEDSWVVDADGNHRKSVYNAPNRVDFQTVFPTLENNFGKDYLKSMEFYLHDLGLDWVYWDESTGPGMTAVDVFIDPEITNRSTYNAWDGNTARISKQKKTIEKPFALLPLITRPLFERVMEMAEKKDGFILFNSAATTKQRIRMPSFAETQNMSTRAYETHLNTPYAYGLGKPTMRDLRKALSFGALYARTHLDYSSSVVEHFYPLTPMEIHSGWVKGKERIVTAQSGDYGWDEDVWSGRLLLWDALGKQVKETPVNSDSGKKLTIVVPEGGIAVLERLEKITHNTTDQ